MRGFFLPGPGRDLTEGAVDTILFGRIGTQERADSAVAELRERGIAADNISTFYLNAPGQHARYAIGGDRHTDEQAEPAPRGQVAGAAIGAVAGLAVGAAAATVAPPLAPAIVAGVTGVGALAGSVAGAVAATDHDDAASDDGSATRRGGLVVAVRVTPESETIVADALRNAGAEDLERTSGEWRDGHWADFDPLQPPQPLEKSD
jgi:hypothetical protein